VLHTIIKIGRVSQTQLVNILLLRSFIHIAYLRNNYMFRSFFLGHHLVDRISYLRQLYSAILRLQYLMRSRFNQ